MPGLAHLKGCVPNSTGLEVGGSTGENSGGQSGARLTAIHHALGHGGVLSAKRMDGG